MPEIHFKSVIVITSLCLALPVFAYKQAPAAQADYRSSPLQLLAVEAVHGPDRKSKDGPMFRAGFELALLYQEHRDFNMRGGAALLKRSFKASNRWMRIHNEYVVIDAVASDDVDALAAELKILGMKNGSTFGRYVSGRLPIASLEQASVLTQLRFVRPALASVMTGAVTSQGDIAQLSDVARSMFGVDGSGTTVGSLSDSYDCRGGAVSDVASNDLPAGVVVLEDEPGCINGTDEGRAMMQIVHDVAPGSNQAFHTAFGGVADFANGILELKSMAGADVINDDVIYFAEPMFQDGPIAQAVDAVKATGAAYFSSAGNNSRDSYEGNFIDSGVNGFFSGSTRHDFDTGPGVDSLMEVTIPGNKQVIIVLQWQDPFFSVSGAPGAATDMDLVLYSSNGQAKAAAFDNNIGGDAVEVLGYVTPLGPAKTYQIGIEHFAGPLPGKVKFVFFGDMTINEFATDSGTAYGHSMAAGARSVGAARYSKTPEYGVSPPILESFSSSGGIPILFDIAGNPVNITRQKPEIVAPDGVDNTFFGSDFDGSGFPNFLGTSAAAPHAAGVAALLKDLDPALTPDNLYSALQDTAIDMNAVGVDTRSGYGLIQADLALATRDFDADGVLNENDNCPNDANAGQEDYDLDGSGDVCDVDDDNDGLSDTDEAFYGTNPLLADTDGDSLLDGEEVNTYGTDPTLEDTDNDGFNDDEEINAGSDPNSPASIPGEATGDINGDEMVDVRDLILMQRIVLGELTPTLNQSLRGDVAPRVNDLPAPNGELNAADLMILQRIILGDIQN